MKISDRSVIGERIRSVRVSKKLTQEQIANKLGVSKVSISLWERGGTALSAESLIELAQELSCSPVWLMTGINPSSESSEQLSDPKTLEILRLLERLPNAEKDNLINELSEKNAYYEKLYDELKIKREQ